jgi:hypothetical protein
MEIGTAVAAVVIGGVILFLWTGATQALLPWGIRSVKTPAADVEQRVGTAIAEVTTAGMVGVFKGVAAFIAVKPQSYYHMGRYFAVEFVTQLLVAGVLVALLTLTTGQPAGVRLGVLALAGMASVFSVDLQYWNWWGFSTLYTVGVAVNRVLGYVVMGAALLAFLLPA